MYKVEDKALVQLTKLFVELMGEGFTGNLQINFREGHVSNINKLESIILDK